MPVVLTVMEWVLRYTYNIKLPVIHQAFEKLLGLGNVRVEDSSCMAQAMRWYQEGFDFSDALHLASCQKTQKFSTLDKAFYKKVKKHHIHMTTWMKK